MAVAEHPATRERVAEGHDSGWPKVFTVRVWLLPEDDRWVAMAPDFAVVGMGRSDDEALADLEALLLAYLNACCNDGLSLEEARRPVPASERLRFALRWLPSKIARWLHRRGGVVRGSLFVPWANGHAGC